MMAYALTTDELDQVRLQNGTNVKPEDLSDSQIRSDGMLNDAVDYVFDKVIEVVNIDALTPTQKGLVSALLNGTSTNIDDDAAGFVQSVLISRQQAMFRRAVMFRVAGNCVPVIPQVTAEVIGGISQRLQQSPIEEKQIRLYDKCDKQIDLLRNAFPSDPIEDVKSESTQLSRAMFGLGGGVTPGASVAGGGGTPQTPGGITFDIGSLSDGTLSLADYIAFLDAGGNTMYKALVSALVGLFPPFSINNLPELASQNLVSVQDFLVLSDATDDHDLKKILISTLFSKFIATIHGTPTAGQIIDWDATNSRLQWSNKPSGGGGGGLALATQAKAEEGTDNSDYMSALRVAQAIAALGVLRKELAGSESDRYASYTNAFLAASDRRGSVCLFNTATGPPTDANAIGQPDIADRDTDGIIAFGATLRTDRDPNNLVWDSTADAATDYVSGQKVVVSVWNKPAARVVVTLTSGGTLVDTGNAAYIWATATWDEVNDIPDVVDVGNYFLISEEEPTDLAIRLPASDILNPVDLISAAFRLGMLTGVEETDASLSAATKLLLDNFNEVSLGELFEHHDQNHTGFTELTGYNFKTGSQTPNAGDVAYDAALPGGSTGAYYIKPKTDDDKALLKKILIAHKTVYFEVDATRFVKFQPTGTPTELFGRLVGSYAADSFESQGAALTNNHAVNLDIASNIPARSEYRNIAFKAFAWDNLTQLTTLADDDSLIAWDKSTGSIVRIEKSDLIEFTKANLYAGVKAILQASTGITITADDTDNELDIAASGGGVQTTIATDKSRDTSLNSKIGLSSSELTALNTAWLAGKDILVEATRHTFVACVTFVNCENTIKNFYEPVGAQSFEGADGLGILRMELNSTAANSRFIYENESGTGTALHTDSRFNIYSIG